MNLDAILVRLRDLEDRVRTLEFEAALPRGLLL